MKIKIVETENILLAILPVEAIRQRVGSILPQLVEGGTCPQAVEQIERMKRWLKTGNVLLSDIIWFLRFIWENRIEPTDEALSIAIYEAAFPAHVQDVASNFAAFKETSGHLPVVQASLELLDRANGKGFLEHLKEPSTLDTLSSLGREFTRLIPPRMFQTDLSPEGTESYNTSLLAGADLQKLVEFTRKLQT